MTPTFLCAKIASGMDETLSDSDADLPREDVSDRLAPVGRASLDDSLPPPKHDANDALEPSRASEGLLLLAENVVGCGLSEGEALGRKLHHRAREVSDDARLESERSEENLARAREVIAEQIVMFVCGELKAPVTLIGEPGRWAPPLVKVGYKSVSRSQAEDLRRWVYELLSSQPPHASQFAERERKSRYVSADTPSPAGVSVVETRYRLSPPGSPPGVSEPDHLGELCDLSLW
jgi:hypothetical protein